MAASVTLYGTTPRNNSGNHPFSILLNIFFEPQTLFGGVMAQSRVLFLFDYRLTNSMTTVMQI